MIDKVFAGRLLLVFEHYFVKQDVDVDK